MAFDPNKHMHKLDRLDLCERTKRDLMHSLNDWARAFVAGSFTDLPTYTPKILCAAKDSKEVNAVVPLDTQIKRNTP